MKRHWVLFALMLLLSAGVVYCWTRPEPTIIWQRRTMDKVNGGERHVADYLWLTTAGTRYQRWIGGHDRHYRGGSINHDWDLAPLFPPDVNTAWAFSDEPPDVLRWCWPTISTWPKMQRTEIDAGLPWWLIQLLILSPLLPMGWRWRRRRRRQRQGGCLGCGYDLRASPDRCPECGRAHAEQLSGR